MDGVRYNGYLIYFSNEWYGINNTRRLYTCTAARVGYTVALLPFGPRELEFEHLPGDPVVLGLGGEGLVVGHGGRARCAGVHSLGGVYICCTPLYTSGEKSAWRESLAAIVW